MTREGIRPWCRLPKARKDEAHTQTEIELVNWTSGFRSARVRGCHLCRLETRNPPLRPRRTFGSLYDWMRFHIPWRRAGGFVTVHVRMVCVTM